METVWACQMCPYPLPLSSVEGDSRHEIGWMSVVDQRQVPSSRPASTGACRRQIRGDMAIRDDRTAQLRAIYERRAIDLPSRIGRCRRATLLADRQRYP